MEAARQVLGVWESGNLNSCSEWLELSRSLILCKLRWFICRSPSSNLFLLLLSSHHRRRGQGATERGSYDEPSLRAWQRLSQPLVLGGVRLITRLRQCHGVTRPRLNALPALSDKSHQTSLTHTPPLSALSVIAVFLSSCRCSIPPSFNQLALTRRKAVPVKTVKGGGDI